MRRPRLGDGIVAICAGVLALWAVRVGAGQDDAYRPTIDPANFVRDVNNTYFPLAPGLTYTYEGVRDGRPWKVDSCVTLETRAIMGVTCRAIQDQASTNGMLQEETLNWLAQDREGNVWCFGKAVTCWDEAGNPLTPEGAWEAGLNDAQPGVVMEAHPRVGDTYRREYAPGVAEGKAIVLALDAYVTTPFGVFLNCLKTMDFSPIQPGLVEEKYFAPGLGLISAVTVEGGTAHLALAGVTAGPNTPPPGSVVINEVLAHSHSLADDWIELYNTTDLPIAIGGWFLSDKRGDLTRYEISPGAVIPAQGYMVLYESTHFGNPDDPGCRSPFALSEAGDSVYLTSGAGGEPTDYQEHESFGPSETSVTFGRYVTADDVAHFVSLSQATPGAANAYPKVGPVVINEIRYGPPGAEYVELWNLSNEEVKLYDATTRLAWRFTEDWTKARSRLTFTGASDITIGPGQYLLIVKDQGKFSATYVVPNEVRVVEWKSGKLNHSVCHMDLAKGVDIDGVETGWVLVDEVNYSDGLDPSGRDLWPTDVLGRGLSLSRLRADLYGDDPATWQAAAPSPGKANP
jgi:hypothetical protein